MLIRIEVNTAAEADEVLDALRHRFWGRIREVAHTPVCRDVYLMPQSVEVPGREGRTCRADRQDESQS